MPSRRRRPGAQSTPVAGSWVRLRAAQPMLQLLQFQLMSACQLRSTISCCAAHRLCCKPHRSRSEVWRDVPLVCQLQVPMRKELRRRLDRREVQDQPERGSKEHRRNCWAAP